MTTLLTIVHIIVCLFLITVVLLQHGKGADVGATFGGGGGSNQSLFGSEGPLPLLSKITTFAAIIFMATSMSLAFLAADRSGSIMDDSRLMVEEPVKPAAQQEPITIPAPATKASPESAPGAE